MLVRINKLRLRKGNIKTPSLSAFDATSTTGLTGSGSDRDLQSPTITRIRNEFAKSFLQPKSSGDKTQ